MWIATPAAIHPRRLLLELCGPHDFMRRLDIEQIQRQKYVASRKALVILHEITKSSTVFVTTPPTYLSTTSSFKLKSKGSRRRT